MQRRKVLWPAALDQFVEVQVSRRGDSSASACVWALLHADAKPRASDPLEALLLDGRQGVESELTAADGTALRAQARARARARARVDARKPAR